MPKNFLVAFVLLCMLNLGLRFSGMTFDSLYLDEAYQTMFDAIGVPAPPFLLMRGEKPVRFHFTEPHSVPEVLHNLRGVDALGPPLYFVTLNRWMALFGTDDFAVRGLSVTLSFAAFLSLFCISLSLFGPQVAVVASLLQTLSPFDLMYAQEARMYAMEIFAACLSSGTLMMLLFQRFSGAKLWGILLAYAVSTWALVNTHYTALFLVLYQALFGLVYCFRTKNFKMLALLALAGLATMVLWLPWFDLFRQAASVRNDKTSFYVARKPVWYWPFWALSIRIPFNWIAFLCGNRVTVAAVPVYASAVAMLFLGFKNAFAVVRGGLSAAKATSAGGESESGGQLSNSKPVLAFLLGWLCVPAFFLFVTDVLESRKVVEMARYLIFTAPAAYLLCALGLLKIKENRKLFITILLVHTVFALVNISNYHLVHQRRPWREMAQKVEEVVKADQILMVSQYFNIICLDRYLSRGVRQMGLSPQSGPDLTRLMIEEIKPKPEQFWLLSCEDGEAIVGMMPAEYEVTQEHKMLHDLHLRLYVLKK